METVSKKRGRPSSLAESEIMAARMYASCTTRRSLQNWAYQTRALHMLLPKDSSAAPYSHFLPSEKEVMESGQKIPHVLLSQIGRLPFELMVPAAQEICDRKLSIKAAIKFVKQLRIGDTKKPFSVTELAKILALAIDAYGETHDSSSEEILTTLQCLSEIVSDSQEGE